VKRGNDTYRSRLTPRMQFHAPVEELLQKVSARKIAYLHPTLKKYLPLGLGYLFNFDHRDILVYYNAIVRGILNYYTFADNRKRLGTVVHLLKWSCARTLGQKFKLSVAKVYKKFGPFLAVPQSALPSHRIPPKFYLPGTFSRITVDKDK